MLKFKTQSTHPVLAPELKSSATEYAAIKVIDTAVSKMVNAIQFKAYADRTTATVTSVINKLSHPQEHFHRTCA